MIDVWLCKDYNEIANEIKKKISRKLNCISQVINDSLNITYQIYPINQVTNN